MFDVCRITSALVQVLNRQVPFRLKARLLPAWRDIAAIRQQSRAQGECKLRALDKDIMLPVMTRLLR